MAGQDAYEARQGQRTARTVGERPGVFQDPAPQLVAEGVPVLLSAVAGHAVSGGCDGRSGGLLLSPFPHGLCVGGQKEGGGGEEGGEEAFRGARGSCSGAETSASLDVAGEQEEEEGAGEQEEEEEEEEEEADASDLLPPLSLPCSSSTTAVARSRLVFFSSRCVPFSRWQACQGSLSVWSRRTVFCARRRLRQWHMLGWLCWYFSSRCGPEMLCIMAVMDQKDIYELF